jgi:hypothetical protein
MTIALVSLLAAAIGCSDAVSPDDALTAKSLGLTEVTAVEGSGEAMLLANFSNPSLCLSAGRSGDQAFIGSCDEENTAQLLSWEADGTIAAGEGMCLDVSGARNGAAAIFTSCDGSASQVWSASSDEHIVSSDGACLDLERRGGGGNSVVIWSCGGRDSQGWGARDVGGDGGETGSDDGDAEVYEVVVSPDEYTLLTDGTVQLTADAVDDDGNDVDAGAPRWSSSNTSVATVRDGLVSAVSAGTATISATIDGVTGTAEVTVESSSTGTTVTTSDGIWISADELQTLPTSGVAWENMKGAADRSWAPARITEGNWANREVLAGALVWARTGVNSYRTKTANHIAALIDYGIPGGTSATVPSRQLLGFILAADLIDLAALDSDLDRRFRSFATDVVTRSYDSGAHPRVIREQAARMAGNGGGISRGTYAAYLIYMDDRDGLDELARWIRGALGETDVWDGLDTDDDDVSWYNPENAGERTVVNGRGTKDGYDFSGLLPNDMRRNGQYYAPGEEPAGWGPFPGPSKTNYPQVHLYGLLVAIELMDRQGYDSKSWGDQGARRASDAIWRLYQLGKDRDRDAWEWWDAGGASMIWLINSMFGQNYATPTPRTNRQPNNIAWMEWTHAR